jgi:hypothetical protein
VELHRTLHVKRRHGLAIGMPGASQIRDGLRDGLANRQSG